MNEIWEQAHFELIYQVLRKWELADHYEQMTLAKLRQRLRNQVSRRDLKLLCQRMAGRDQVKISARSGTLYVTITDRGRAEFGNPAPEPAPIP